MEQSKNFVLGRANPDAYGNLELYCQHYKTPYALFICSLVGAGLIMIGKSRNPKSNHIEIFLGFMQFSMSLSANYSLLQKKFSRPMAKYRENAKKAHAHAASEKQNLIPPSYAPSVPGIHAPSQKFDNSYNLPPNPGYGSDAYTSVVRFLDLGQDDVLKNNSRMVIFQCNHVVHQWFDPMLLLITITSDIKIVY